MNAQRPFPAERAPGQAAGFPQSAPPRTGPGREQARAAVARHGAGPQARAPRPVLACINGTPAADAVVHHARMLADALGEPLVILQVREPRNGHGREPADPVEWAIAEREARARLDELARSAGQAAHGCETMLAQGWAPDAIRQAARRVSAGVIVLAITDHPSAAASALDEPARLPLLGRTESHVLASSGHSVLLHPPSSSGRASEPFRRILVPLDGSCWAEAALPMAIRLARNAGADLLLAHVVAEPKLTGQQLPQPEDLELLEQLVARNERAGRLYLERMRRAVVDQAVRVDTLIFRSADSRKGLADLIATADFDLVVLSARGHGAIDGAELPYGSTVDYLAGRFSTPMLIVRPDMPKGQPATRSTASLPARPRIRQPR